MARILIVENRNDDLEFYLYVLNNAGHDCYIATNRSDALKSARHDHPQLIVCSMEMPDVSGCEIAAEVKGDSALKSIPLVAISSNPVAGERTIAIEAGFDHYIAKPIDSRSLTLELNTFLNNYIEIRRPGMFDVQEGPRFPVESILTPRSNVPLPIAS